MSDFFRGWRQRSGLVLLVVALVLMSGWIRSLVYCDLISFRRDPDHVHMLFSNNAAITWAQIESEDDFESFYENSAAQTDDWEGTKIEWRSNWFGFDFGEGVQVPTNEHFVLWSIPYWAITLSVTLISAYLLLKRHRISTVKVARPSE